MSFPIHRPRRLRTNKVVRDMVRETNLTQNDLIYPMFVTFGKGVKKKISSMPGCSQMSVDEIVKEAQTCVQTWNPGYNTFRYPGT